MDFRLSCPDFAFPLLHHDGVLDLIAAMGFAHVDIGIFQDRSHLQPSDQYGDVQASASRLKQRLDQRGLAASDVFIQGDLDFRVYACNSTDAGQREHARKLFLQTLEYAHQLECPHVTGLPGVAFTESEPFANSYARCVEENAWRVAEAAKSGIAYGVEAHIDSIIQQPEQALRLMLDVPGLGLTMDYSHFVRLGMPDSVGDRLLPYANHFHARGAANGRLQVSVAENEIDFARILNLLRLQKYSGAICLEYCWTPNWENCSRNDNLSEILLLKEFIASH